MSFDDGQQQAVWLEVCRRIEGRLVQIDGWQPPPIQVYRREWRVTLDVMDADSERPVLRLRAPFFNESCLLFSITHPSGWSRALALFDRDDADSAPLPKHLFQVESNLSERFESLLSQRELAARIAEQQPLLLAIQEDAGRGGAHYPAWLDLLVMHASCSLEDPEPILGAYELFADLVEALDDLQGVGDDLEERLLRRLEAPADRICEDGLELWDGGALHAHAANVLGARRCERALPSLVRLTQEERPVTRLAGVRALRRLENPEAIPALIPLLTDERTCGSTRISDEAAATLRKLGAGNWVDWFERVVGGSMDGTRLAGPYREPAIQALLQVARTAGPQQTANACLALADLGAPETLRAVREAVRRLGRPLVGAALDPLLEKLESGADLPRPATAPLPERGSLPVPSDSTEEGFEEPSDR